MSERAGRRRAVRRAIGAAAVAALVLVSCGPDEPTEPPTSEAAGGSPDASAPATASPSGPAARIQLRDVFLGINSDECTDTTEEKQGRESSDVVAAEQVVTCHFVDFEVDFHDWPDLATMTAYITQAKEFHGVSAETREPFVLDGTEVGEFYIWRLSEGRYKALWSVDPVLMTGRLIASADSADVVERHWAVRGELRVDPAYAR